MEQSGASIGIVGGGQLAWMLALAARQQGMDLHVQAPTGSDPAPREATSVVLADLTDVEGTRELARRSSAISFENEWLDLDALSPLVAEGVRFLPDLDALRPLIDKASQRQLLDDLALPSPRWCPLVAALPVARNGAGEEDDADAAAAGSQPSPVAVAVRSPSVPRLPEGFAFPLIAKASRGGYDGKGTRRLEDMRQLEGLLAVIDPADWILEECVRFEQELALVACRDQAGRVDVYPVVETHQHDQVCDWVLAPADLGHSVQAFARNIAASLLTSLDYVGVLSIEFFYGPAGLQINELAPRTHNSAHYTIEACRTSQFAQQLRIVAGEPLASTELIVPGALMVNLLGLDQGEVDTSERRQALAALPGAHLHWYGKSGSSPGRKLGHVTLLLEAREAEARRQQAAALLEQVRAIWPLPSSADQA